MKLIKTKSFKLATISAGNIKADKLALVLPGRLDTKDYACFPSHIELLASRGFYAVSFDPPGTWESPGGIELFSTSNYILAVNELIGFFGNRPTLLFGHSRGGATAIHAGTNNPSVVGIVTVNASLGAPTPPTKDELKDGKYIDTRDIPPGTKATKERKKFVAPLTYFSDGAKYDDSKVIKTCTKPKLMFYSIEDEFNSPEFVKEIFKKLSEPKVLHELEGKHDYRLYPEVINEVNKVTEDFIDKYL